MEPQTPTPTNPSNTGKIISIVAILVLIVLLMVWLNKKPEVESTTPPTTDTTTNPGENVNQEQPATPVKRKYTNGTFSANGNYVSPAGVEEVAITLIIENDVISSATFEGKATVPTSQFMQGKFSEGFAEAVIGKSVDEVALTVVNGSSLTPKGFMDALEKIKTEASNS